MPFTSINPATGQRIATHPSHTRQQVEQIVTRAHSAFQRWRDLSPARRAAVLRAVAATLRKRQHEFAALISEEMGKPLTQAQAEVLKSALGCDFYAKHGARMQGGGYHMAA